MVIGHNKLITIDEIIFEPLQKGSPLCTVSVELGNYNTMFQGVRSFREIKESESGSKSRSKDVLRRGAVQRTVQNSLR